MLILYSLEWKNIWIKSSDGFVFSFLNKNSNLSLVFSPPNMLRVIAVVATLCLGDSAQGYATSRDSGYSAPEQSYQEPGYEASSVGYGATEVGGSPDITPILIGVLVLTGLALLFPSYVNLTSVRRKRSSEGIQGKRSIFQPSRHDIQVRPRQSGGRCGC